MHYNQQRTIDQLLKLFLKIGQKRFSRSKKTWDKVVRGFISISAPIILLQGMLEVPYVHENLNGHYSHTTKSDFSVDKTLMNSKEKKMLPFLCWKVSYLGDDQG